MTNFNNKPANDFLPPTWNWNKLANCATIVLSSVFSIACGGSGGSSGDTSPLVQSANGDNLVQLPADTITRLGMINVAVLDGRNFDAYNIPAGLTTAYGEFVAYEQTLSNAYLNSEYSIPDIDTCNITIDSSDDTQDVGVNTDPHVAEIDSNSRLINAGSALSISTPNGSWPDLISLGDQYITYEFQTDTSTLGQLPSGSSVNIPGDEFPAFDNIVIPTVTRFTDVSISNASDHIVTPDTTVHWAAPTPSAKAQVAAVSISSFYTDPVNNSEMQIDLSCHVSDDGEFSFPENARQLLSRFNLSTDDLTLSRFNVRNETHGDAAVVVINAAVYFF